MSVAIGIDLGTTNTVVAAVVDGVAVTLEDESKRRLLPSVVSFHPSGTVLVGEPARERRLIDPENTIYSIKPLIGRTFDSEEVKAARLRFPFQLVEGAKSSTMVMARDVAYALPEISAFVLRRAKAIAERALGETVDRAVITVPANFNDLQRASTKIAGKLAGLEVMRILNEPTAAALAYGQSIAKAEKIAVYDFGGGTFDVTLLDLTGNVFEVLATAGDTALGGDDVDARVADLLAQEVIRRFKYDPRTNPVAFGRLRFFAEQIKKDVSTEPVVERELTGIGYTENGQPITMKLRITRDDVEKIARPFIERTVSVARQSIEIVGLHPKDFDRVLLVGGSTRMPLVPRMVEELFEKPPHLKVNPDEVVALGAAIQAHALNRSKGVAKRKSGHDALAKTPLGTPTDKNAPNPHAVSVPRAARIPTGMQSPSEHPTPAAGTPQVFELSKKTAVITFSPPSSGEVGQPPLPPPAPPPRKPATTLQGHAPPPQKRGGTLQGASPPPASPPTMRPIEGRAARPEHAEAGASGPKPARTSSSPAPLPLVPAMAKRASASGPYKAVSDPRSSAKGPPVYELEDVEESIDFASEEPPAPEPSPGPVISLGPDVPDLDLEPARPSGGLGAIVAQGGFFPSGNEPPPPHAPAPQPEVDRVDEAAFQRGSAIATADSAPLLIDVTPLSLRVETVGGYSDVLITANSPVPCEKTRTFLTASDHQTSVTIRVAQGESSRFAENAHLGELELSGLKPATRGEVKILVTFELDADGILNVRAKDRDTGRETQAAMRLLGTHTDAADVAAMQARQARHVVA